MEGEPSFRDKDPWHAQGHYLVMDGLWIFHHDQGQGSPLLLLHGVPTSSYLYRDCVPILAESHRVMVYGTRTMCHRARSLRLRLLF